MEQVTGYNENFHFGGWRKYGHLVVNFSYNRVTSVWYRGERIYQVS